MLSDYTLNTIPFWLLDNWGFLSYSSCNNNLMNMSYRLHLSPLIILFLVFHMVRYIAELNIVFSRGGGGAFNVQWWKRFSEKLIVLQTPINAWGRDLLKRMILQRFVFVFSFQIFFFVSKAPAFFFTIIYSCTGWVHTSPSTYIDKLQQSIYALWINEFVAFVKLNMKYLFATNISEMMLTI